MALESNNSDLQHRVTNLLATCLFIGVQGLSETFCAHLYVPGEFIDNRKNVNVISDTQQSYKKKQRLHVFSELFGSLAKNSKADIMNLNRKQKFTAV